MGKGVNRALGALDLVRQLVPLSRQRQKLVSLGVAAGLGSLFLKAPRLGAISLPLAHAGPVSQFLSYIRQI
jgi:hypothetical protein